MLLHSVYHVSYNNSEPDSVSELSALLGISLRTVINNSCTHRYPLDLEALPEEAAEILEASTCDMEAQLQAMGQQATHIVLDAMAMAVLDMKTVDATIESICEQVLFPRDGQSRIICVPLP